MNASELLTLSRAGFTSIPFAYKYKALDLFPLHLNLPQDANTCSKAVCCDVNGKERSHLYFIVQLDGKILQSKQGLYIEISKHQYINL